MGFLVALFIICVYGCWKIARGVGQKLFPDNHYGGYVDKSVHHHHYYHSHEHRNITVIDPETKKKILEISDSQKN